MNIKSKFTDKTVWLYTGYVYEEISDLEVIKYVDVLVDGPYVDELRDTTLRWRGSSNQRVIRLGGQ
jgi:anaerobic ribonucleoside-triphosphate reductase activating protein